MPQHGWKSNHNSWNHLPDLRIENFSFGSEQLIGRRELYNSTNFTDSRARQLFQPQPHPQQHRQVQRHLHHHQQQQRQPPQNSTGSTRIACRLCDQIFTSVQDLINHVESHTESTIKREPINTPGVVGHSLFPKKGERFSNGHLGNPSVSAPPPPPPLPTTGLSFTKPQPQHHQGSGAGAAGTGTYPVWPYFSKVPDNAAAKKMDAPSEFGDLTMPLLSQLERPLLPAGSGVDGFEWLDLTLKLGMK